MCLAIWLLELGQFNKSYRKGGGVLTRGAFIVEVHTQLKKLKQQRKELAIGNKVHLSIHATPKTNVPNVTIGSQICDSDVYQIITGFHIVRNL